MAINVYQANNQATQLASYAGQLRTARSQLSSYKSSLDSNWQGKEVVYMKQGIDNTIRQIDVAIRNLESLSTDVRNTAAAIKREDDAREAAARAAAARAQRIRQAEEAYNRAVDEWRALDAHRANLEASLRNTRSLSSRMRIAAELAELQGKMSEAQRRCDECGNALNAARR